MTFDWTISLGSLITAAAFVFGGIAFIWTMRTDIKILDGRIGRIEDTMNHVTETMVQLARQEERQNSLEERMGRTERRMDDLARGEGFLLPISRSTREVGGP